jgi:type I restriction enzyme S subunit
MGWRQAKFVETVSRPRSPIGKVKRSDYKSHGEVPVVDQGQEFIAGYADAAQDVCQDAIPVIVFGDHTRIFKYVDFPFLAGADGTQILVPNQKFCAPMFLFFAFSSLRIPSRGYNRHFSRVKEMLVPLPPLPEQKAIAHVLRTVQKAKEATEKVIAATRQLKQSLMRHLFTYGPVPFDQADKVELKETEIGEVPVQWELKEICEVAEVKTSTSSLEKLQAATPGTAPVLYLKVSDMNHPSNLRRIVTAASAFNVSREAASALNAVPSGATVLPKRGAAIATNKKRLTTCLCLLDPNLVAIIPGDKLAHDYLFAWFERFDLRTITDTTTLPQINKKDIEPLVLPVPSQEEQRWMASWLSAVEKKAEQEEARRDALNILFQSLLHHLMTGKVRVNDLDFPMPKEVK